MADPTQALHDLLSGLSPQQQAAVIKAAQNDPSAALHAQLAGKPAPAPTDPSLALHDVLAGVAPPADPGQAPAASPPPAAGALPSIPGITADVKPTPKKDETPTTTESGLPYIKGVTADVIAPQHYVKSAPPGAGAVGGSGPAGQAAIPGGPIAPQYTLRGGGGMGLAAPPFDKLDEHAREVLAAGEQQRTDLSAAQSAQTANAVGTNEYTRQHAASLDDLLKIQQEFREKSQGEVATIAARNEELAKQAAAEKIDPEHYWATKGTGTKIAMALSMALGEFGSHMPHVSGGGQNLASQLIQAAIQRDVESQKDNIQNKWKAVTAGTELVKNKIAEGNFVADQLDKQKLLAEAKLRAQLTGLQAVADSASKKAILSGEIEASVMRDAATKDLMENRRYGYRMSLLAGQAALARQQQKDYEEKYLYPSLIKKQEAHSKGEPEPEILPQGGVQGIRFYGQQAQNVPGAVPERDREAANKELALTAEAQSLAEAGKNVHSVSYDPRRYFQDTDTGQQKLINDQYRTQVELIAKKVASLRMPEEERSAALSRLNSVIPEDGDNEARTRAKVAAAPHVIGADITPILRKYGAAPPAPPKEYGKIVQPAGK